MLEYMPRRNPVNRETYSFASPISGPYHLLPSESIFYRDGDKIYELDPLDFESKTVKLLMRTEAELSKEFHVSKDKTKVCVKEENEKKFTVYDVNYGSSDELNLPYHYESGFLFRKPDLLRIIYVIKHLNGEFSIHDSGSPEGYKHKCPAGVYPRLLDQFSDGSAILYKCVGDAVYRKNLKAQGQSWAQLEAQARWQINPLEQEEEEDVEVFKLHYQHKFILSPDDTKVIIYNPLNSFECTIVDLLFGTTKQMRLNFGLFNSSSSFAYSNDQRTLYVLLREYPNFALYSIDLRILLYSDKTTYELEPSVPITLSDNLNCNM